MAEPNYTPEDIDPLYAQNPGAVQVGPGDPVVAEDAQPGATVDPAQATATTGTATSADQTDPTVLGGYDASTQDISEGALSSRRLAEISSRQTPLMQRATQRGLLTAGKRGLQNSSIAAGAVQGEIVDRATPLALQEAEATGRQDLSNQAALNQASQFTAQQENVGVLETARMQQETELFNAQSENQMAQLNSQLETAVSQGNAEEANRVRTRMAELETEVNLRNSQNKLQADMATAELTQQRDLTNMAAENRIREEVLRANAELNRQFLAGTQAMDLASIQGRYSQLISSNNAAAALYQSYFDGISQAMANNQLTPERVAQYVNVQQSMLEAGLRMMDEMNSLNLGDFELPGAVGGPVGIEPTPGSGITGPGGSTPAPGDPTFTPGGPGEVPPPESFTPGFQTQEDLQAYLDDLLGKFTGAF